MKVLLQTAFLPALLACSGGGESPLKVPSDAGTIADADATAPVTYAVDPCLGMRIAQPWNPPPPASVDSAPLAGYVGKGTAYRVNAVSHWDDCVSADPTLSCKRLRTDPVGEPTFTPPRWRGSWLTERGVGLRVQRQYIGPGGTVCTEAADVAGSRPTLLSVMVHREATTVFPEFVTAGPLADRQSLGRDPNQAGATYSLFNGRYSRPVPGGTLRFFDRSISWVQTPTGFARTWMTGTQTGDTVSPPPSAIVGIHGPALYILEPGPEGYTVSGPAVGFSMVVKTPFRVVASVAPNLALTEESPGVFHLLAADPRAVPREVVDRGVLRSPLPLLGVLPFTTAADEPLVVFGDATQRLVYAITPEPFSYTVHRAPPKGDILHVAGDEVLVDTGAAIESYLPR